MEEPAIKRARQACLNCRKKKTRCSGEKPSCSYCTRLRQRCYYQDQIRPAPSSTQASIPSATSHAYDSRPSAGDLAARVAILESRLARIDSESLPAIVPNPRHHVVEVDVGRSDDSINDHTSENPPVSSDPRSKFAVIPPGEVLRSAADVYFLNCQNQPYCYFHEDEFRRRLEEGSLPDYLILAFLATATRFSSDPFFEGRQFDAIGTYARTAWRDILKQALSSDLEVDIHTVQATNMLAVADFTAGRNRLGWVKIGLSVRFAQGLRLNAEPDPLLPVWRQEEQRRVFWSLYLLDKLVSCGRSHPPTILDADCTVRLPASEHNFRAQISEETPTLQVLHKLPDITQCLDLDHFALAVLAASFLGRILRHTIQKGAYLHFPPWDSRSDYAKMLSLLLSFECILTTRDEDYASFVVSGFTTITGIDRQRASHFIWSRALYQLCHCLLTHPYVIQQRLKPYNETYPRSFRRETLRRCQHSAGQLVALLKTIEQTDCCARGSFLGYLTVVAGTIHQLNTHSENNFEKMFAQNSMNTCLKFLEHEPTVWEHYPRMATALRDSAIDAELARALISEYPNESEVTQPEKLWCMLDYAWLCDINRSLSPTSFEQGPATQTFGWGFFEDLIGDDMSFPDLYDLQDAQSSRPGNRRGPWLTESGTGTPTSK